MIDLGGISTCESTNQFKNQVCLSIRLTGSALEGLYYTQSTRVCPPPPRNQGGRGATLFGSKQSTQATLFTSNSKIVYKIIKQTNFTTVCIFYLNSNTILYMIALDFYHREQVLTKIGYCTQCTSGHKQGPFRRWGGWEGGKCLVMVVAQGNGDLLI